MICSQNLATDQVESEKSITLIGHYTYWETLTVPCPAPVSEGHKGMGLVMEDGVGRIF